MIRLTAALLLAAFAGACSKSEREMCATALYVEVTETGSIVIGDQTIGIDGLDKALRAESVKCDRKKLRVMLGGEGLGDIEGSKPILKAVSASKDVGMVGFSRD